MSWIPSKRLILATSLLVAGACSDDRVVAPRAMRPGPAAHDIVVSEASVYLLSAEVRGPDLRQPYVYDLPLEAGGSAGSLSMPVGGYREVVLRAHDQYGEVTHEGSFALERLTVGANEPIGVALNAVREGVAREIDVKLDIVGEEPMREGQLVIQTRSDAVYEGQQMVVQAYVLDAKGNRIEMDPSQLHWAVSDPRAGRMVPRARDISFLSTNARLNPEIIAIYKDLWQYIHPKVIADPFVDVTAGAEHTCALRQSGAIFCWGFNQNGQLGSPLNKVCAPTLYCQDRPTLVSGSKQWNSVSAGDRHTCAIDTSRQAFCWGEGDDGKLGNSSAQSNGIPNPSPLAVGGGRTWDVISAGLWHTCGIEYVTGNGFCWGSDNSGALGDGVVTGVGTSTPKQVVGGHMWRQINASFFFTCARDANMATWCWGTNNHRELGHTAAFFNIYVSRDSVPRLTDNTLHALDLSKGVAQTSCFTALNGSSDCWGDNYSQETGTGLTSSTVATPTPISGGFTFTSLATAGDHTCGITSTNTALCWGSNTVGQLGDGTTTDRATPTSVSSSLSFTRVAAGGRHTCGIATDGNVYCWGEGWLGLLGNATMNINSSVPVKVAP